MLAIGFALDFRFALAIAIGFAIALASDFQSVFALASAAAIFFVSFVLRLDFS